MKSLSCIAMLLTMMAATTIAQRATFTGSVLIYGSGQNTRTTTSTFDLTLERTTPASEVAELLTALQNGGQDDLQRALRGRDVGRFSIGSHVGVPVQAAVVENVDGRLRIRAVLERWKGFGELWRNDRSLDYPFSYIEIYIDRDGGGGQGTFIAAAKIRWRNDKGQDQVEIEDFGTFPGRLMGVRMRGRMPS